MNYVNRLKDIYARHEQDLPSPRTLGRRLLEEATELFLTLGGTAGEALAAVADALANEARKRGVVPSDLISDPGSQGDVASEIADIGLIALLLASRAEISRAELDDAMDAKLSLVEEASVRGEIVFRPDGRFYRMRRK